jgi:DNA-directed RNA polymerase specialized sigma subunit
LIGSEPIPGVGAAFESHDVVESCLRRLPRTHALACRLIYVDGKSLNEAASVLGYSKSYMSRLHRDAIEWLSKDLGSGRAGSEQAPAAMSN